MSVICQACTFDMPEEAVRAFYPEEDVVDYVCRDTEACAARQASAGRHSKEIPAPPRTAMPTDPNDPDVTVWHARDVLGHALREVQLVRAALGDEAGQVLERVIGRLKHVDRVLGLVENLNRAAWNSPTEMLPVVGQDPTMNLIKQLTRRVEELEKRPVFSPAAEVSRGGVIRDLAGRMERLERAYPDGLPVPLKVAPPPRVPRNLADKLALESDGKTPA